MVAHEKRLKCARDIQFYRWHILHGALICIYFQIAFFSRKSSIRKHNVTLIFRKQNIIKIELRLVKHDSAALN